MGLEQFLLVRPDGSTEKSKPYDKISTDALSFFSCSQNNPATQGFSFLGGTAYIGQAFVNVPDTAVNMGAGGNYQTTAIPANNWNVMVFNVTSTGMLLAIQGTPAASQGSVVIPQVPFGNFPVAQIFFQDNGSAGPGTILPIQTANIIDVRPFFSGNYGAGEPYTNLITDFQLTQTFPPTTNVTVNPGNLYFSSGVFLQFAGSELAFGTGGAYQTPALPIGWYNQALVSILSGSQVSIIYGISAAISGDVGLPVAPQDALPIALIMFQDNGSGGAGTIVPIVQTSIIDARPVFQNILGQVKTSSLDNLRIFASTAAPDTTVTQNAGNLYPLPDFLIQVPLLLINLGTGGNYQLSPITAGYFQRVLITLDGSGDTHVYQGTAQPTLAQAQQQGNWPTIPQPSTPLAFVDVSDNGTGGAGTINPIYPSAVTDIRPWLGSPTALIGQIMPSMQRFVLASPTTTFTLTQPFLSSTYIEVYQNGVRQDEGGSFDWTRNTGTNQIIFTTTIPTNAVVDFEVFA